MFNPMKRKYLLLICLISFGWLGAEEVPEELLSAMEQAFQFMDAPPVACEVEMITEMHMENLNGKKPFDIFTRTRLTAQAGELWDEEILETRTEGDGFGDEEDMEEEDDSSEDEDFDMIFPDGENRHKFQWKSLEDGSWEFSPLPEFRREKGISSGKVRAYGGNRIVLDLENLRPPAFMPEMRFIMELSQWEDYWVMDRMEMEGMFSIVIMRKRFTSFMSWENYRFL